MTGGTPVQHHGGPMNPVQLVALSLAAPWVACRRAWQSIGFGHSLVIHLVGIGLFFLGLILLDSVFWYGDMTSDFSRVGPVMLVIFMFWLLGIELSYLIAAVLTCCWGSDIERLRTSVGRAMCRWYQLTPFHAAWSLGFIVAVEAIEELRLGSYDYGSVDWEIMNLVYSALTIMAFLFFFGVGGWFTLRALAVPKTLGPYSPKCRWPALCETCGYAIVGLTEGQSCPECGRSVQSSLYTPRGEMKHSTLNKMRLALFNPALIGETLVTRTRSRSPYIALAVTALALLATGPIGVTYVITVASITQGDFWMDSLYDFLQVFIIGGLGAGLSVMLVGVSIVLSVGSIIGIMERLFGKRNTLPSASYAACYASGYVVFLALLMFGFAGVLAAFAETIFGNLGFSALAVLPLLWIALMLLLTVPYFFIVGRILRSARYANA